MTTNRIITDKTEEAFINKIASNLNINKRGSISTEIVSKDGEYMSRFSYSVVPGDTITFKKLEIDPKLRGMGIMNRIFNAIEKEAARKGFTKIVVANFENIPLAYYFATKRGYTLYTSNTDTPITNLNALGKFVPDLRKEPRTASDMMSRMSLLRQVRKAGVDPAYAVKML